jgi:hypothetical protein
MRPSECTELNEYRLSRGWSWRELAAAMQAANPDLPISPRTLHYTLTQAEASPHDTTVYKIRRFLDTIRRRRPPTRRRKVGTLSGARA